MMSNILEKILGNKIFRVPEDSESYRTYPPLSSLKKKVIIKGKSNLIKILDAVYPNREFKKAKKVHIYDSKE